MSSDDLIAAARISADAYRACLQNWQLKALDAAVRADSSAAGVVAQQVNSHLVFAYVLDSIRDPAYVIHRNAFTQILYHTGWAHNHNAIVTILIKLALEHERYDALHCILVQGSASHCGFTELFETWPGTLDDDDALWMEEFVSEHGGIIKRPLYDKPAQYRKRAIEKTYALIGCYAGQMLIWRDNLFTQNKNAMRIVTFFVVAAQLPIDLQQVVAHRVYGSTRDVIVLQEGLYWALKLGPKYE
jgi:hypothetical protein